MIGSGPGPQTGFECFRLGLRRDSLRGFVEVGAITQHRVQRIASPAGQRNQRLIVLLVLGAFPVVIGLLDNGSFNAANADKNNARFSTLLLRRDEWSPRIDVPDRHVTGARPA